MKLPLTVMKVLLMVAIPAALILPACVPTTPMDTNPKAVVISDSGGIVIKSNALIREGQEVLLYDLDGRVFDPYVEINKPSPDTYIPQDIQVTDTVEGRAAVSFTHKDGIHYTLFFNEDQGASIMRQGIFIKTMSDQFVPAYLWYLFEARDIPRDIPVLFIDGVFNWYTDKEAGIIELRKERELDGIEIKELGEKLCLEEEDENGVHLRKE